MLIDEMAETLRKAQDAQISTYSSSVIQQLDPNSLLEVLNLKMLNQDHPYLAEILWFCKIVL